MATCKTWVVNASPLILLGKLQRLDLLELLAPALVVPESVMHEVAAGTGRDESTAASIAWARRHQQPDVPVASSVMQWDLGAGETQVIAHCLASSAVAVLDDGEARACAQAHDLPLIGTLGVILRARIRSFRYSPIRSRSSAASRKKAATGCANAAADAFAAHAERHFGRARLASLQTERGTLASKLATLDTQRDKTRAEITQITAALAGSQAPQELAAHAEEFARAERERQEAQRELATLIAQQNSTYAANRPAREEQARRVLRLRHDRSALPADWKDRSANAALTQQWESAAAIKREIERIEQRLREDDWITDATVIALRDLRQEDYQRQSVEQERRAKKASRKAICEKSAPRS